MILFKTERWRSSFKKYNRLRVMTLVPYKQGCYISKTCIMTVSITGLQLSSANKTSQDSGFLMKLS